MVDSSIDPSNIRTVEFSLSISADEYLRYYRGHVKWVVAISTKGLKVKFPANLLSSHVSHDGVQGRFVLQYLTTGKAVSLRRLAR